MKASRIYSKSVLGLFSLLLLFIATAGSINYTVYSANQANSDSFAQVDTHSIRRVSLISKDIIYNPVDQKIYASAPSDAGSSGNSLVRINPTSGEINSTVFVGSEPGKLALASGGQTMYVALDGASAVRSFDTAAQTAGAQFSVGRDSFNGIYRINDLAVAPDNPNIVAIARHYYGSSPPEAGVAVFDNGVQRPQTGPGHSNGADFLAFSNTGSTLYGGGYSYGLRTMSVDANGITVLDMTTYSVGARIIYDTGTIFSSSGQVIDAASRTLLGTFSGASSNAFVADKSVGRAYYLVRDSSTGNVLTLKAYDINTFTPIGSLPIPNAGEPTSLVRWGANGLAFRTSDNQLILIQTSLIPSSDPIPTPTATVTPTATPTAPYIPTFVRKVNLPANDLVYNEATQSIYASIPSAAGFGIGNTITKVNPQTGEVGSSVFVGSEPNKLAIGNDGRTIYTRLDGVNGFRRFDALTGAAGLQFTINGSYQFQDMEVMPGSQQTLAVAVRYNGVVIYDDGVPRPNISNGGAYSINTIEFSDSPSTIYGLNNETTGNDLAKLAVNSSGTSGVLTSRNIIYGSSIEFADGLLYATGGRVTDPETSTLRGTFQASGSTIAVDPTLDRIFFLNNNVLSAYDTNTFLKIGSVTLPSVVGTPTSLVRWGANGLAFRTANTGNPGTSNSQVYLIQSELVSAAAPIPTGVQLDAATYNGGEFNSNITATVTRTGDLSFASNINYATSNGTATAGSDYTAVSGTLNFAVGESSKTIMIPVINDNIFEGSETFNLTIDNPTTNTLLLFPNTAVLSIADNDSPPNTSLGNVTINEPPANGSSIAVFTVALTNPTTQTATISYTTANGTATAGSDYTATSGTLTFNPLETTKTVVVPVNGDETNEGDETFFLRLSNPVNASISVSQATATIRNFNPQTARGTAYDFDGDAKADVSVFRPNSGQWYLLRSAYGFTNFNFGLSSDKLVPADYDGDLKTDFAVYRDGAWYVERSQFGYVGFNFGEASDIPQPMDIDGDRRAELVVFRPSNGTWYIFNIATNQTSYVAFGQAGDKPVAGDYDGDGRSDIAVFRPSNGVWYLLRSTQGFTGVAFGESTDRPVVGDYDGDGKTDIAVFRPSNGTWYLQRSQAGFTGIQFGLGTDQPTPADYDGDGKTDVAVFREGAWYMQRSQSGFTGVTFGAADDKPIPNSFVP